MEIDIKIFSSLDDGFINDIFRLSQLMEDAGEFKRIVFIIIYSTLLKHKGTFFIASIGNKKVAYGFLAHGTSDPNFRRLIYFAVEKDYRNKQIGFSTLKAIIRQETVLTSGISLACQDSLYTFYKKLGFEYLGKVEGLEYQENEIALSLVSPLTNTSQENYGTFFQIRVTEDKLVFDFYENIKNKYKINLLL